MQLYSHNPIWNLIGSTKSTLYKAQVFFYLNKVYLLFKEFVL